ncbi:hypothetical protein [Burkholderia sp. JKS000303]|uniref:hypothetical protein n=1 Tax=Burkholderia sp. JKS000303 TaxID=1938747 RepID=UPI000BF72B4D|nr:hypothetical protein [Burkholderia sp. JKS000303]PFH29128.1 hypothetical protein BX604_2900 [Burkholderia sp. JKS000303]
MFEWLKRLVARRELEELDRWRRLHESVPELHPEQVAGPYGGQPWTPPKRYRGRLAGVELTPLSGAPTVLFSETRRAEYHAAARQPERDAAMRAQCELRERGIDYRFLGVTGEEDS